MTELTHRLTSGTMPILISIPHLGRRLPQRIAGRFSAAAQVTSDTDWHLDTLYNFASRLGASVLTAEISRYAIDLNRPPSGESLYPGQTTTGLCPSETFKGEPLYKPGEEPNEEEVQRRLKAYWQPYHAALKSELQRLRAKYRHVLLWEAHSICSHLPRLFAGKLPDLNFGTNGGATCDPDLLESVLGRGRRNVGELTYTVNGRFRGGYITRHYGNPEQGLHAIQLEMCQSTYMDESPPFSYRPDLAFKVQPLLERMLGDGLHWLNEKNRDANAE